MEEDLCVGVAEEASGYSAPTTIAGRGTSRRCHKVPRGSSGQLASEVILGSSLTSTAGGHGSMTGGMILIFCHFRPTSRVLCSC